MGLVELIRSRVEGKSSIDPAAFRKGKPLRNPLAATTEAENDARLVTVPLGATSDRFMATMARWMKAPATKQFELDAVGAFVWDHCDGATTFAGISKMLQRRFKMNSLEADVALASYLKTLNRRGLITYLLPDKSADR